jgi:hypothetical protein
VWKVNGQIEALTLAEGFSVQLAASHSPQKAKSPK